MRVLVALVLLAVACPPEAWGQSPKVKYGDSDILRPKRAWLPSTAMSGEAKGRYVLRHFASCVIDLRPNQVRAALAIQPGEDTAALKRAASENCLLAGEVSFSEALFRGALFGELYRRHERGRDEVVHVEQLDFTRSLPANAPQEAVLHLSLLALADCVYQQEPETVRAIVTKPTGSPAQKKAYAGIPPLVEKCVPQGKKLALSRTVLEGSFGEYLYRSLVPVVRTPAGKAQ